MNATLQKTVNVVLEIATVLLTGYGGMVGIEYLFSGLTPQRGELQASISFHDYGFEVSNRDDFVWTHLKMAVSSDTLKGNYQYTCLYLNAGTRRFFYAGNFRKAHGEKLNILQHKPRSFSIECTEGVTVQMWPGRVAPLAGEQAQPVKN